MSILKGLLTAREGSYFKSEQEDDLSAYRRRRIREGALKETDVPLLDGERSLFPVSDTKLAEIHAQEARVSAPMRGERLRVSSQMPPISTEGGHSKDKSIAGTYRVPSARGAVWGGLDAVRASHEQNKLRALLPEESAAMRKTKAVADKALVAGMRALAYGSLFAAAGVFGGGMLAATALNIRDANDLRLALLNHLGPSVASAKLKLVPYKEWLESHGLSTNSETLEGQSTVRWIEDSVIVRDLRRKFRMRRSGE